jgi:hypothetical protein
VHAGIGCGTRPSLQPRRRRGGLGVQHRFSSGGEIDSGRLGRVVPGYAVRYSPSSAQGRRLGGSRLGLAAPASRVRFDGPRRASGGASRRSAVRGEGHHGAVESSRHAATHHRKSGARQRRHRRRCSTQSCRSAQTTCRFAPRQHLGRPRWA